MICSLLKALYPIGHTKVDGFCKAISGIKDQHPETIMTIAEEYLADVAAPESWGKGLSAYDVLRHKLLLGNAEKFLVVYGSLSGIQDYLFDVKSSHALKQLRGRSFYLYLLQFFVLFLCICFRQKIDKGYLGKIELNKNLVFNHIYNFTHRIDYLH